MRHLIHLLVIILISCSGGTDKKVSSSKLFVEGTSDWTMEGDAQWEFNGEELIGKLDSGAGFVISTNRYSNFELTLEFKPDSIINSGVFVRCKEGTPGAADCYEINIWDLHPNQDNRTGAIVTRSKPTAFVETLNKWNRYRIRCEGNRIQAWVNEQPTADLLDDQLTDGLIALQAAGSGVISFRNVVVNPLKP